MSGVSKQNSDGIRYRWAIKLPMTDRDDYWTVCRCDTPEGVAELIRMLLSSGDEDVQIVRVERQTW